MILQDMSYGDEAYWMEYPARVYGYYMLYMICTEKYYYGVYLLVCCISISSLLSRISDLPEISELSPLHRPKASPPEWWAIAEIQTLFLNMRQVFHTSCCHAIWEGQCVKRTFPSVHVIVTWPYPTSDKHPAELLRNPKLMHLTEPYIFILCSQCQVCERETRWVSSNCKVPQLFLMCLLLLQFRWLWSLHRSCLMWRQCDSF